LLSIPRAGQVREDAKPRLAEAAFRQGSGDQPEVRFALNYRRLHAGRSQVRLAEARELIQRGGGYRAAERPVIWIAWLGGVPPGQAGPSEIDLRQALEHVRRDRLVNDHPGRCVLPKRAASRRPSRNGDLAPGVAAECHRRPGPGPRWRRFRESATIRPRSAWPRKAEPCRSAALMPLWGDPH